jgi:hypothetical protein
MRVMVVGILHANIRSVLLKLASSINLQGNILAMSETLPIVKTLNASDLSNVSDFYVNPGTFRNKRNKAGDSFKRIPRADRRFQMRSQTRTQRLQVSSFSKKGRRNGSR